MAGPPRVVLATRLFAPEAAAAALRLRALASALADLDRAVEVLTTVPPPGSGPVEDDPRVRVRRLPALRDKAGVVRGYVPYLSFDLPLAARLLARRPARLVVVEPPPTTGLVVRLVCALWRRPYAYYAADVLSDALASGGAPALLVLVLRRLESWVLRGARLVLAVSEEVGERVRALGVPGSRVAVVGNGVDTALFRPDGPSAGGSGPYLVYAGTMSQWQGVDVLVRAFATVHGDRPETRLVFLGQGADEPALRALAARLCPDGIEFRGVVPPAEAAGWIRGARAALVSIRPGIGYDFAKPTKVYAATACGVPVIFAGAGAGQRLVADQRLGWAVAHDPAAVAEAMTDALDGDPWPQAARERLVRWTRDNASLSAVAARAAEALNLVVHG
ncbi:MAG: glycosyltransferase family 4 protein [Actinomycetales bacterium]